MRAHNINQKKVTVKDDWGAGANKRCKTGSTPENGMTSFDPAACSFATHEKIEMELMPPACAMVQARKWEQAIFQARKWGQASVIHCVASIQHVSA